MSLANKSSTAPHATVQNTAISSAHHDYQLTPNNPPVAACQWCEIANARGPSNSRHSVHLLQCDCHICYPEALRLGDSTYFLYQRWHHKLLRFAFPCRQSRQIRIRPRGKMPPSYPTSSPGRWIASSSWSISPSRHYVNQSWVYTAISPSKSLPIIFTCPLPIHRGRFWAFLGLSDVCTVALSTHAFACFRHMF